LGGNTEDRAVEILQGGCKGLPAKVEGYKKTDPPAKIAARFAEIVEEHRRSRPGAVWTPRGPKRPAYAGGASPAFPVKGGRVWIDPVAWKNSGAAIISRSVGLLRDESGRPGLAVTPAEFAAKDSEMIACEVDCRRDGIGGPDGAVFVDVEIPGLAEPGGGR
jgi:hypothetical protein